jgi:hypothetical protein
METVMALGSAQRISGDFDTCVSSIYSPRMEIPYEKGLPLFKRKTPAWKKVDKIRQQDLPLLSHR